MLYLNGMQHLTIAEVSRRFGLPRASVLKAIKDGRLKAHWHRYHLYVPQVEADRFLEEDLNASVDRIAARLLRAMGARVRLIFSWKNGHERSRDA